MDELITVSQAENDLTKHDLITLGNNSLDLLPSHVLRPQYDRSKITPGIVHIGVGNFHRAHLAWYIHRLMQEDQAMDWGIVGAGVRAQDMHMRQRLSDQDFLTTLIELNPNGDQATEVTGAMVDFLPVEDGHHALINAMTKPEIRIVSLTVTEGGYFLDPDHGGLHINHPDIQHDAQNPDSPRTAFGAMIAALRIRRDQGIAPFTALCCDNLQGNGNILRQTIVGLAKMIDAGLAAWIDAECAFPNSMVDCIVPATGPSELELAQSKGIEDHAPVTHEPFRQWVIEDVFSNGRPDWHLVGAEFSDRVHDFESQKIRILNGGHQILANTAEVMGIETIAEAIDNPLIHGMFRKVQEEEILPHVKALPNMSVSAYLDLIDQRFANKKIVDTVRRVAFDGAARHMGFLLPTLRERLQSGASAEGLAFVEAAWARMCAGTRDDRSVIEANDPSWESLNACALSAQERPTAWLEMHHIYGDLVEHDAFVAAFEKWLSLMYQDGMTAALTQYLDAEPSS